MNRAVQAGPAAEVTARPGRTIGPLLYLRGMSGGRVMLTALTVTAAVRRAPEVLTERGIAPAETIRQYDGARVLRYTFSLPMASDAWYALDDVRYQVNTAFGGDLRIAFVSCNGQEHGDRRRPLEERNVLWRRLARQHAERPFQLLLHGGDQFYADELLDSHPRLRPGAEGAEAACSAGDLDDVAEALRRGFFRRYLELLGQPEIAWLMARTPSLAMWDDHDICDGWGSKPAATLDSPVGRRLFEAAREHFLMFQLGAHPAQPPCICLDATGTSLSWRVRLPQLQLIAPDLRSERSPRRVMGERGWRALDTALGTVEHGRVLLLSSVPALGPRLSWVEALLRLTPGMEKYEDDLRDQWQSRAHRAEWRAFLERLARVHARGDTPVTLLSGEIHLATRGTLDVPPAPMHQLVASGVAHPAPASAYARMLGALARLGESPLPGHPIRLWPLPGRSGIYTAQRNYLVLERQRGQWRAWWELEDDGPTPALEL